MGVIPFEFTNGVTRKSLSLKGDETVSITEIAEEIRPLMIVPCEITCVGGTSRKIALRCRIDTEVEIEYLRHGGVLHYVLRNLAAAA